MPKDEIVEVSILITGDVQGVGFRATAKNFAKHLGLIGTVRNLSNGSVQIVVQGERNQIDRLLNFLREQFPKISSVNMEDISPIHSYHDFRIIL